MDVSRRDLLRAVGASCLISSLPSTAAATGPLRRRPGWVEGHLTGAQAVVDTLLAEGCMCVFGIPGAQQNELWDVMKSRDLGYLLVTHENSASTMADGYARSTGKPGVICVVPGPGLTNSLSGIGEALLDSVPMVCIVGDVANGRGARPFQVHSLNQVALLQPVTKQVLAVQQVGEIPQTIRHAFHLAMEGEPGPVGVVIPYNLLIDDARFNSPPLAPPALPYDDVAAGQAFELLSNRRLSVGIYAGMGCMDHSLMLVRLAEVLQAPVATSIAGKGVIPETHPLSVGWGYGPHGTKTAEEAFKHIDCVLAIGVKYSEVSSGFYSQPEKRHQIHVDINRDNLGRVMRTSVCVHADAGVFLSQALDQADRLRRPADNRLIASIRRDKEQDAREYARIRARTCVDPVAFFRCLRQIAACDALTFVDVTVSQYWMTEMFTTHEPRTFFNPTNNQSMGWSIPAALGAQRVHHGRQVLTVTGDGCFLMSGMEISTAARENLPVKFFILDDQAYRYMQELQCPAYLRTTATILARLDYQALAQGWGVAYHEIPDNSEIAPRLRGVFAHPGPVLCRVAVNYRGREVRWIENARAKYTRELTNEQKVRFLARIGSRALNPAPDCD